MQSYVCGQWVTGSDRGVALHNAVTGEPIGHAGSSGIDFTRVLKFGREHGAPALRKLRFHERAALLKRLAQHLMAMKEKFYAVSAWTGATRADGWVDIEGGIGTVFSYASIARREFANETFLVEGAAERLSAKGSFIGRHILVPREGVSVHINAFNFPCWGMLEKIAPSLLAGVPVIVKPATVSCYLAEAMVREIVAAEILPPGALQLICGGVGDLLEHLDEQDCVTFTGSASTGRKLKTHPNIVANSIPFNMEADSLNCSILGADVTPDQPEFELFVKEVVKEMTTKAGQKCTAIRRVIVPENLLGAVQAALVKRLESVRVGDPGVEGVRMGPLVGTAQRSDVWETVERLRAGAEVVYGGSRDFEVLGADPEKGAFFPATLLLCAAPLTRSEAHEIEAFGPVATLMPYRDTEQAIAIARLGKGSLVGSLFTADNREAARVVLGCAAWHGRMLVINRDCAKESTGHGSPLAALVHGGPGRAGGGEELGGSRAIKHYMQRTAIQGSPDTLTAITREFNPGSSRITGDVHPFRRYFEDLQIGETLITHRRTVTEADIVNFGCLSGDHFYAHFDELAAKDSLFGKRVAHGYFVISAAAGMFVSPAPGPVLANYGMENLRFVEPVGIGDTIQARLTAKQKIAKDKRSEDEKATGVVVWEVEVSNQDGKAVAVYDILTLVERRDA
ncbi:MAG: phenylacetic acid degradation bifunctional protein PaaZ [Gammaproteobacteria bacterium]|nr:phenylacetic acid degradation bifunctional protein PaaZ [Gammaproteobacteria bacterium]MBK6584464.1 phenylacetic acid degradation bifunctional protein PaaZ [Gammaproteobacteria bacterium]MBK7520922.1 phenylacetic acid degradation bifunctional protein PaaZ [Gammaproteobacteria bacterium]MBK7727830.1 phenylacetic acid degradation bifunctional protein PaaZ [Gammaproteobacteria bacterium]MBK8309100.1 phenylacetic acid degradation bifunctional protein PaaZ [Gammaproteobacteria bacterium]